MDIILDENLFSSTITYKTVLFYIFLSYKDWWNIQF